MIQMHVDLTDLKRFQRVFAILQRDFPQLSERCRKRLATRTKSLAKMFVTPRFESTGNLKNSIILKKEGPSSTEVIASAPYAGYVEMGTAPHSSPNFHRIPLYLRKGWKGNKYPWISHPGARPMRFMTKAYEQVIQESEMLLQDEVSKFFKERGW